MTRLIISSILFLTSIIGLTQNSYDSNHSKSFGDYLFNTGQYRIAAQEYERALFLTPGDTSTHLMLFKSYCKLNTGQKALESYYSLTSDTSLTLLASGFADAYLQQLIRSGNYSQALTLANNGCCIQDKGRSLVAIHLMQGEWAAAQETGLNYKDIYTDQQFQSLVQLSLQGSELRYKKKGLSALMSAIIPGSGKFYTGYWQDGLISMVMTSISGFMAYRAYNKYGINNPYTWVSGVMAVGYYGGNIYGGYSSAKRYNKRAEQAIIDEAKAIYNLDF